jgi:hypothetical protein
MNDAGDVRACDFATVYNPLVRRVRLLVVEELAARRIVPTAVTRSSTDDWIARQLREATPPGEAPKYPTQQVWPAFLGPCRQQRHRGAEDAFPDAQSQRSLARLIGTLRRVVPGSHADAPPRPPASPRHRFRRLPQPLQTPSTHRAAHSRSTGRGTPLPVGQNHIHACTRDRHDSFCPPPITVPCEASGGCLRAKP